MNKTLGVIAITGLALCVLFMGLAFAKGGESLSWLRNFNTDNWLHNYEADFVGDKPVLASAGMKQWNWTGDGLEIDIPAEVHVGPPDREGGPAAIIVRGSQRLLDQVQFANGKLALTGVHKSFSDKDRLDVTIHGRLRQYVMAVGELKLGNIEQDKLSVRISGAGEVSGEGKVGDLDVAISGFGGANFGRLATENARVRISGAGEAKIRPSTKAEITLSGIGEVDLRSRPKTLVTHISGLGHINGPDHDDDEED